MGDFHANNTFLFNSLSPNELNLAHMILRQDKNNEKKDNQNEKCQSEKVN